jgi:PTH1 family peptidyl-tRNA hydrolase
MAYMKLSLEDLVVIHDDMDVPLGRLKIGKGGGAGGHRGVLSIIEILGTQEFLRVKLGIGRPPPQMSGESYVLSHFPLKEAETIVDFVVQAAQAVETLLEAGLAAAQHRFHGPPL